MGEEYTCPNCKQAVEPGAQFCGNCGQPIVLATPGAPVQIPVTQAAPVAVPVAVPINYQQPAAAPDVPIAATVPEAPVAQPMQPLTTTPSIAAPIAPSPSPVAQVYASAPPATAAPQAFYPGQMAPATPQANPATQLPNYAVAYPHPKQHRAAIGLALGILGIGAGLLIAIVGIGFGIAGIVMATTSYKGTSKGLKIAALIFSILAVLVGTAVWIENIVHDPALHNQKVSQAGENNGTASLSVTTPCYTVGFTSQLNVNNAKGSCAMNAYNGDSLTDSTNVYKVLSNSIPGLSQSNFAAVTKKAIDDDVSQNLPGFSVTNESSTTFAGDTAYYVQASDTSENVAVVEEGVLHGTSSTNNFFVLVHATSGSSTDLSALEKNWHWND